MSQPPHTTPAEEFSRFCPVCLGPIDRCTHLIELRDALAAQQATAAERRDAAPVASPAPSLGWGDVLRRATEQLHEFNRLAAIEINAVRWLTQADIDRARRERAATRMRRYGLDPKWDPPALLIPAAQPRSGVRGLRPADIR